MGRAKPLRCRSVGGAGPIYSCRWVQLQCLCGQDCFQSGGCAQNNEQDVSGSLQSCCSTNTDQSLTDNVSCLQLLREPCGPREWKSSSLFYWLRSPVQAGITGKHLFTAPSALGVLQMPLGRPGGS